MNRRSFIAGFSAALAGGLLLPERKIWALDQTMTTPVAVGYYNPITERGETIGYYQGGIYRSAFTVNRDAECSLTLEKLLDILQPIYNKSVAVQ